MKDIMWLKKVYACVKLGEQQVVEQIKRSYSSNQRLYNKSKAAGEELPKTHSVCFSCNPTDPSMLGTEWHLIWVNLFRLCKKILH